MGHECQIGQIDCDNCVSLEVGLCLCVQTPSLVAHLTQFQIIVAAQNLSHRAGVTVHLQTLIQTITNDDKDETWNPFGVSHQSIVFLRFKLLPCPTIQTPTQPLLFWIESV